MRLILYNWGSSLFGTVWGINCVMNGLMIDFPPLGSRLNWRSHLLYRYLIPNQWPVDFLVLRRFLSARLLSLAIKAYFIWKMIRKSLIFSSKELLLSFNFNLRLLSTILFLISSLNCYSNRSNEFFCSTFLEIHKFELSS